MARRRSFRITILRGAAPAEVKPDVNKELQWFCTSLGLVGNRDKNLSTFRIFIVLLKARQKDQLISSDALAAETELTRATVIHHLNKLSASGLVVEERERYKLAVDNMEELVKHIQNEVQQSIKELEEMSRRIDEQLGLK